MSVWTASNVRNVIRAALKPAIGNPRMTHPGQSFEKLGQPARMTIRTGDGGKFLITVEEIKDDS